MTEQEAREQLEALLEYGLSLDKEIAVDIGIKALEEVQQHKKNMWKLNQICRDYTSLGTVEELKEAKEKQIAKKLKHEVCPNCSTNNDMIIKHLGNPQAHKFVYCWNCGQALEIG